MPAGSECAVSAPLVSVALCVVLGSTSFGEGVAAVRFSEIPLAEAGHMVVAEEILIENVSIAPKKTLTVDNVVEIFVVQPDSFFQFVKAPLFYDDERREIYSIAIFRLFGEQRHRYNLNTLVDNESWRSSKICESNGDFRALNICHEILRQYKIRETEISNYQTWKFNANGGFGMSAGGIGTLLSRGSGDLAVFRQLPRQLRLASSDGCEDDREYGDKEGGNGGHVIVPPVHKVRKIARHQPDAIDGAIIIAGGLIAILLGVWIVATTPGGTDSKDRDISKDQECRDK